MLLSDQLDDELPELGGVLDLVLRLAEDEAEHPASLTELLLASFAHAVSADGAVVVGESWYSNPSQGFLRNQAFRWTAADGMVGLGGLPNKPWSFGLGVSADGAVVVGASRSSNSSNDNEAFIWDAAHGMRSLQDVLASAGADVFGWNLMDAYAVSADGDTVVGFGFNPSGDREAWRASFSEVTPPGQCNDGIDNDGDGLIDYPADPGCTSPTDPSEHESTLPCDDGVDNDGDGLVDYPADPGCTSPTDPSEHESTLPCDDGVDNDGDGLIDYPADPGCTSPTDPSEHESTLACDDGIDNDGDGLVDLADPDCQGDPYHPSENPACSDGIDNDGLVDFDGGASAHGGVAIAPPDPGCLDATGTTESPACQDGIDNDGDGGIDFDGGAAANNGVALGPPDLDCWGHPTQDHETVLPPLGCGLGAELSIIVPLLMWLHRRRRRPTE